MPRATGRRRGARRDRDPVRRSLRARKPRDAATRCRAKIASSLAATQLLFDGVAAPEIYARTGKSSFIVPYTVAGKPAATGDSPAPGELIAGLYNFGMVFIRAFLLCAATVAAQTQPETVVLKPARVFDGEASHDAWLVRVRGGRIESAG